MRRRLRPEVAEDLAEAADWYDGEQAGLGTRFLRAVEVTLQHIEREPQRFPIVFHDLRRALLPRPFPYQVFFRVHDEHVEVFAVFHSARDPQRWQRRR